jgi:S1-C subfamily serine protease
MDKMDKGDDRREGVPERQKRKRDAIFTPLVITILLAAAAFVLIMFVVPGFSDIYLMKNHVTVGEPVSVADPSDPSMSASSAEKTAAKDVSPETVPALADVSGLSALPPTTDHTVRTTEDQTSAAKQSESVSTETTEVTAKTTEPTAAMTKTSETRPPVCLVTVPPVREPTPTPVAPAFPEAESWRIRSVIDAVAPSVVTFYVSLPARDGYSMQTAQFSGVIIDSNGTIATNGYNFQFALTYGGVFYEDAVVQVFLQDDDRTYSVDLIGRDPNTDIALFCLIDPPPLKPVTIDPAPKLHVGDFVIACGGADLDLSGGGLSIGYITGMKRRSVFQDGAESGMIQTSAFITPLFSGAPLLNESGHMIGLINSNVQRNYSDILGYALPSGIFASVVEKIVEADDVPLTRTPWLGLVLMDEEEYAELARKRGFPAGLMVTEVEGDSAANTADVRRFDVVTSIDEQPVTTLAGLRALLEAREIGERIILTVYRTSTGRYHRLPLYLKEQQR